MLNSKTYFKLLYCLPRCKGISRFPRRAYHTAGSSALGKTIFSIIVLKIFFSTLCSKKVILKSPDNFCTQFLLIGDNDLCCKCFCKILFQLFSMIRDQHKIQHCLILILNFCTRLLECLNDIHRDQCILFSVVFTPSLLSHHGSI